jgi:hypothetical protein
MVDLKNCLIIYSKEILKHQISWKCFQWELSRCMWTDIQTWRVAFSNFANAPNERSSNSPVQLGDFHNSKKWQCTSSCNIRLQMTSPKGNILQQVLLSNSINIKWSRLRLKCDGTHAKARFCLSAKWTSPFKSAGASVQSTTGSRGVRISGSNAGHAMFRGNVKVTGYPLHSPVLPSLPVRHRVPSHFNWTLHHVYTLPQRVSLSQFTHS